MKRKFLNYFNHNRWMYLSFFLLTLMLMSLQFVGCGDSGSAPSGVGSASSLTSLSQVPGATTSVSRSYGDPYIRRRDVNAERDAVYDEMISPKVKIATSGKVLSTLTITPFSSAATPSRAACEISGILKDTYSNAVNPDKIKCYIASITENYAEAGLSASDIKYDGSYNHFTIVQNGATAGTVKFKLKKINGFVSEFEMFECMSGTGSQSSYMHTTLTKTLMSLNVKRIFAGSQGGNTYSYKNYFTVTGSMSGTELTAKQLTNIYSSSFTSNSFSGSNYGKAVVDEYVQTYKVNAFEHSTGSGSWSWNSTTSNYANSQDVTIELKGENSIKRMSDLDKLQDISSLVAIMANKSSIKNRTTDD